MLILCTVYLLSLLLLMKDYSLLHQNVYPLNYKFCVLAVCIRLGLRNSDYDLNSVYFLICSRFLFLILFIFFLSILLWQIIILMHFNLIYFYYMIVHYFCICFIDLKRNYDSFFFVVILPSIIMTIFL